MLPQVTLPPFRPFQTMWPLCALCAFPYRCFRMCFREQGVYVRRLYSFSLSSMRLLCHIIMGTSPLYPNNCKQWLKARGYIGEVEAEECGRCRSWCSPARLKLVCAQFAKCIGVCLCYVRFQFLMPYCVRPTVGHCFPLLPMFYLVQLVTGAGSSGRGPRSRRRSPTGGTVANPSTSPPPTSTTRRCRRARGRERSPSL